MEVQKNATVHKNITNEGYAIKKEHSLKDRYDFNL